MTALVDASCQVRTRVFKNLVGPALAVVTFGAVDRMTLQRGLPSASRRRLEQLLFRH